MKLFFEMGLKKAMVYSLLLTGVLAQSSLAEEGSEEVFCVAEDECYYEDVEGEHEDFEYEPEAFGIRIPSIREIGNAVSGALKVTHESVAQALHDAGIKTDFRISTGDKCAISVGTTVGGSMACVGCIAASTETAGATAVACSKLCGTASGALVAALYTCKI